MRVSKTAAHVFSIELFNWTVSFLMRVSYVTIVRPVITRSLLYFEPSNYYMNLGPALDFYTSNTLHSARSVGLSVEPT